MKNIFWCMKFPFKIGLVCRSGSMGVVLIKERKIITKNRETLILTWIEFYFQKNWKFEFYFSKRHLTAILILFYTLKVDFVGFFTWCARQMRSKSCRFRNFETTSAPNVKETPRSFSPQPCTSLSGSDQRRSHKRPEMRKNKVVVNRVT